MPDIVHPLGWFRQCDFISHTTDVDIGIFIKEYREELVGFLETSGLVLTHRFGRVGIICDYCVKLAFPYNICECFKHRHMHACSHVHTCIHTLV